MIDLTINDRKVAVEEGATILEAALKNGIDIPNLCYDRRLKPYGACRLCIVEVEGQRKFLASCSTPVEIGMVVKTDTPKLQKARRSILELLLIHHPLDCPVCDKAGECKLQDLAFKYGPSESRFKGERKHELADTGSPLVERDPNRCILCGKCVRVCYEVQGVGAINLIGRGFKTKVSPAFEEILNCEFCGQCIDACPVGALGRKPFKYRARAWFLEEHDNICPYCGVGCTVTLDIRENRILRARGMEGKGINKGDLCSKGRFGFDFIYTESRLETPLIRKDGELRKASWEEALYYTGARLHSIIKTYGHDSIGAIGSPRCTVEDNYMLQKFMRKTIGSNHIDSSARFGYAKIQKTAELAFGLNSLPIQLDSPLGKDAILIIESDITSTHPVWGLRFLKAKNEGSNLIVADPRETKLTRHSSQWLRINPGTGVAILNGIMKVIIDENLYDIERVSSIRGFSSLLAVLKDYTPESVSRITGITKDDLIKAARDFALAKSRLIALTLGASENTKGLNTALAAANLSILTGDGPSALQMPAEYSNTYGSYYVGVRPELNPKSEIRNQKSGKDIFEMLYKKGSLKALYIMGEDPVVTFPDATTVENVLSGLDFLVVQDIRFTDTAKLAHVVLPASSWAEKDGSFINAEGLIQKVYKIVKATGDSIPDWQILRNLSRVMGAEIGAKDIETLRAELKEELITYDLTLTTSNLQQWSFNPTPHIQGEEPDTEFPLSMVTGNIMQHSGELSVMSKSLSYVVSDAFLQINGADAERYRIKDNSFVKVTSRRGSVYLKARISEEIPEGAVFVPVHFPHARVNILTFPSANGKPPLDAVKIEPA